MSRITLTLTLLAVLTTVAMFGCFFLAIWEPWGHGEEWNTSGGVLLFASVILGVAAGLTGEFK